MRGSFGYQVSHQTKGRWATTRRVYGWVAHQLLQLVVKVLRIILRKIPIVIAFWASLHVFALHSN